MQELKEELKTLGLDVKGVKADLVKRLEEALKARSARQSVSVKAAIPLTSPAVSPFRFYAVSWTQSAALGAWAIWNTVGDGDGDGKRKDANRI